VGAGTLMALVEHGRGPDGPQPSTAPELLGLTVPYTEADLAALDDALGLDAVEAGTRARG